MQHPADLAPLVADYGSFVRLTLSGVVRGPALPWRRIVVRPVLLKGQPMIQVSRFDERHDITKNFSLAAAEAEIAALLELPYSNVTLERTTERIQIQRSKKGKVFVQREDRAIEQAPELSHNRIKRLPLPAEKPDPFLEKIGIMGSTGIVRPSRQRKFTQINEFLNALEGSDVLDELPEDRPLHIVDCGCGSAYLTFGAYHYLNDVRAIPAQLIGVDASAELIAKCRQQSAELGYTGMTFVQARIEDWQPEQAPDMLFSLHACDTATDDALALAVRAGTRLIMSVPCCHQDLNGKIQSAVLQPMLRYGIMRQRTADIVTDVLRAQILRILGYRVEIFEFVSPEQTSKNLMLRAMRHYPPGDSAAIAEYRELKKFWQVTPYLEQALAPLLATWL